MFVSVSSEVTTETETEQEETNSSYFILWDVGVYVREHMKELGQSVVKEGLGVVQGIQEHIMKQSLQRGCWRY